MYDSTPTSTPSPLKSARISLGFTAAALAVVLSMNTITALLANARNNAAIDPNLTPFIIECNGGPILANNKLSSKSQCLGRIQGILEGQRLSAEMALDYSKNVSMVCAPANATGQSSIDQLANWYNSNPQLVDELRKQYDSTDLPAAVMIAALNAVYPCN